MPDNLFSRLGEFLQKRRPWYTLPRLLAVPRLVQIRNSLAKKTCMTRRNRPSSAAMQPKTSIRRCVMCEGQTGLSTISGAHTLAQPEPGSEGMCR
jgi:hypothetical protein